MELATLIIDNLNITQTANNDYSHKGDKAIDINKTGSLRAPFTGTIKRISNTSNTVWLESNNKVKYADGTIDYMTIMTIHDNDVSNLSVDMKINKGDIYYDEGIRGNATGNHIHIAVGKGKFTGNGWYKNEYGNWCINNQYDIYNSLFLDSKVNIINDGGYKWIKTSDTINNTYTVTKGDTLYKIARMYNTTVNELATLNNIKNVDLIYVGDKMIIPNIKYYKKYTGNSVSIVDALKSLGEASTYNARSFIAIKNNIQNYMGTGVQNTYLLNLLKQGKLIK